MSEDKVVVLRGNGAPQAIPGEPVPGVVALLRDMLAQAESGAVVAVALAVVGSNHWTQTAYMLGENAPHWNDMIAVTARLQHRLAVVDLERDS